MERNFCFVCGGKLEHTTSAKHYCPACKQDYYINPAPTAEVVFVTEDQKLLLCKRRIDPYKGSWDLCGGFIDIDETAEAALKREIKEELGLEEWGYSQLVFLRSWAGVYPWGKIDLPVLTFDFIALLKTTVITPADDVEICKFVNINEVDFGELSNPTHYREVIDAAKEWLEAN